MNIKKKSKPTEIDARFRVKNWRLKKKIEWQKIIKLLKY